MKIKRLLAAALSCMMLTCAFTACGDKDDEKSSGKKADYMICAEEFCESINGKDGSETYYTYTLPGDGIKALKDANKWDDMIEDRNDDIEDELADCDYKVSDVTKEEQLSASSLKNAEKALKIQSANIMREDSHNDNKYTVTEGYEINATIKTNNKVSGKSGSYTEKFCVIKIDGENNWKVVHCSADDIDVYADLFDRTTETYDRIVR